MGGLLGGNSTVSTTASRISSFQVTQSSYGAPISLIFGTTRVSGTMIDYIDFTPIAHTTTTTSGGKGGSVTSSNTSYTYTVGAAIALGEGKCTAIGKIWKGSSITDLGSENMTLFDGSVGQSAWGYMLTNHPERALGYSGTAYVAGVLDLGNSANLENYNFEYYGLCQNQQATPTTNLYQQYAFQKTITISNWSSNSGVYEYVFGSGWVPLDTRYYSIDQAVDEYGNKRYGVYTYTFNFDDRTDGYDRIDPLNIRIYYVAISASVQYTPKDANPRDIIYQIMTNQVFACKFPTSYIDDWSDYSTYCKTNSLLLSPAYTSQSQAKDTLDTLLEATNSEMIWSQGKAKIVPYYDNLTPVYSITDDKLLNQGDDSIVTTRTSQADVYNVVPLEYLNRDNDYNTDVVYATDLGDADLNGVLQMSTKSHHEITSKSVAQAVAEVIKQKQLYIRNQHVIKLGPEFILLEPMDPVTLTIELAGFGITALRVVSIKESGTDYSLEVTLEDNPSGVCSAPEYETQAATRGNINLNVDSGTTNTPTIFEPVAELTASGFETWIAASGGTNWGGYSVWVSDNGNTYKRVGNNNSPARYGTLTADLSATSDSLQIKLNNTSLQLSSGTADDAKNLRTICWVDGEAIAYTTATLTATGCYTLTGLVRGAYNTTVSTHLSGSNFVRCDDAIYKYPFDQSEVGRTVYIKLTAFNIYGGAEQSLADVTAYSHVLTEHLPPDVSNIVLDENTYILKDGTALTDILVNFTEPTCTILDHYNVYYDENSTGSWTYSGPVTTGTGYKIKALKQAQTVKVKVTTVSKFTLESVGIVSNPYTITGKSDPPDNVTGLSSSQDSTNRSNILLVWNPIDPVVNPDLKGYEVRLGNVWATGIKINNDVIYDVKYHYIVPSGGNYSFMVKAIDNSSNYSNTENSTSITATVVPNSSVSGTIVPDPQDATTLVLSWQPVTDTDLSTYEIRQGTDWSTGTLIMATKETSYRYKCSASGSYSFMVAAKNVADYYSSPLDLTYQANIEPLAVSGFAAVQMISDRTKVELSWDPPTALDVDHYEIRQGTTWDTATVIGNRVTGTFFDYVLPGNGSENFWIKAINAGGKYSLSPAAVTGVYNLAPDTPTNLVITQDPNDRSNLILSWTGITESDLLEYDIRVGLTWDTATPLPVTKETSCNYSITSTGSYKFIVKAKNTGGFYSGELFDSLYAVVEPSNVTNFGGAQNGASINLSWDKSPDNDVVGYEIRQGGSFANGQVVASGITLQSYTVPIGDNTYYQYSIKAINRSGHYSQSEGTYGINATNIPPKNIIYTADEIVAQSGTAINTEFGASSINFSNLGGHFPDYPTTKFSDVGGQTVLKLAKSGSVYATSGTYICQRINMGSVITANISVQFISTILLKAGLTATLQYRTSQNGTDFTPWAPFNPVQATFQYLDFQVQLATGDTTISPEVNHLIINVDVPDKPTYGTATIAVGGTTVAYGHTYYEKSCPLPTAIGAGLRAEIQSIGLSSFVVKVVNSTGTDVGGQITWQCNGY